jgi:tryptophan-rich sensory protein
MDTISSFIQIILISTKELLYLFGIVIVVGIILGIFERYSNTFMIRALGSKGVLVTAWIGVPIHEIGHLIQCFIWGHKVTKVKLLQLNRSDGVLGYVEHRYNTNSLYQQIGNFFIGLGPIFSGIGSLILGMYLFVPDSFRVFTAYIQQNVTSENLDIHILVGTVLALVKSLLTVENFMNPLFWMYLWIAISISSHIALSKADIKGATKGLLTIFFILVLINLVAEVFQFDSFRIIGKITKYNAYVLAFFSISLLFSFLTLVVSYSLYQLKRRL